MLPPPASGVSFRLKPEVGCPCLSQREAILLLLVGFLRRDYARFPEDDPVRVALELLAEEDRVERDLVRRDLHYAERVQELLPLFAELLHERVVGSPVVEDAARVACDMACDEVDVVLRERVERDAVQQHAPLLAVLALDMRLLRGAVGVAVEQVDAARQELRRVVVRVRPPLLDHVRVRELGAVVREDHEEEPLEQLRPRQFPEHVEDARARLGGLPVAEEHEHEPSRQDHREEDLPADAPDHGVYLRPFLHLVDAAEPQKRPVVPPCAALRVGLGLLPLLPRPAAARLREVSALRVEEPARDVVVHGALLDGAERLRVVRDDVPHGLPPHDAGREHRVHPRERLRVRVDARARVVQEALPVRLRPVRDVEALHHGAGLEVPASVADAGRDVQPPARALDEVRADLEAPRRAAERPLRVPAVALDARARVEERADAVRAPVAPVARDRAVDYLVEDGGLAASPVLRYLGGSPAPLEEEVYALPVLDCHLLCHVGIPFVSVGGVPRPHARTPGCRWRIEYPTTRLRESKRTSFPWEGYGFLMLSITHAIGQPSPTPHCRSNQTKAGAFTSANYALIFRQFETDTSRLSGETVPSVQTGCRRRKVHKATVNLNTATSSVNGLCSLQTTCLRL